MQVSKSSNNLLFSIWFYFILKRHYTTRFQQHIFSVQEHKKCISIKGQLSPLYVGIVNVSSKSVTYITRSSEKKIPSNEMPNKLKLMIA
jgi:hypothetical protein